MMVWQAQIEITEIFVSEYIVIQRIRYDEIRSRKDVLDLGGSDEPQEN